MTLCDWNRGFSCVLKMQRHVHSYQTPSVEFCTQCSKTYYYSIKNKMWCMCGTPDDATCNKFWEVFLPLKSIKMSQLSVLKVPAGLEIINPTVWLIIFDSPLTSAVISNCSTALSLCISRWCIGAVDDMRCRASGLCEPSPLPLLSPSRSRPWFWMV